MRIGSRPVETAAVSVAIAVDFGVDFIREQIRAILPSVSMAILYHKKKPHLSKNRDAVFNV